MLPKSTVNLGRLLLSLSDALDLCSPRLATHQLRTAYICIEMGRALGLSEENLCDLFIAASLHDVGALSTQEKESIHSDHAHDLAAHAKVGEKLFSDIPWLTPLAPQVGLHHTGYRDRPGGCSDKEFFDAQLINAADRLERAINRDVYILHQSSGLIKTIKELSGRELDPLAVEALAGLARREEFWLDLTSPRLYSLLLHNGPYHFIDANQSNLSQIAALYRHIIDYRSHFTATHSTGVSQCATMLAGLFGLGENEVAMMEIAGSFHDLGKLVVPNEILEKPAGLDHDEFAVMRQHTYWTFSLLNSIGGMDQMAEWAAFHHERLDGSGYPFHVTRERISAGARIMMVADISTAVIEDRPYRKGMKKDEVIKVLRSFSGRGLIDANVTELFLDNYDEVEGGMREKQAQAMSFYLEEINPHPA